MDEIIRVPNNLKDDVDEELYSNPDKIYGLSIYSRGATEWKSYMGTLSFLYGIWINFNYSNKIYDEMNNRLIKFRMDLDDDFHGSVFFNFDNKPINIIKSFKILKNTGLNFLFESDDNQYTIIDNISYLFDNYNDDDYSRFPKLKFGI